IQLDRDVSVIEFYPPKRWIGKSLAQLELRKHFQLNIIGFREHRNSDLNIHLTPNYTFKEGELLMAVTESQIVDNFEKIINLL
ncbi:TrkA C-terminal domain-containing protein, partial [Streptococcus danieliae]|nr:TrkA C-terminal domain-containing protein [Streptococcus danieliae]